ncbi:MAG: hypothetical protein KAS49_00475 [Candidatus Cloacimonetes bacterium]|nr:hypothetical protein [Candidatus Cloacimonadota bacterium]
MKKHILLILLIFSIALLSAEPLNRSIGMSAGYISGSGISYRVMEGKTGYQFTAGNLFESENKDIYSGTNIAGTFYYNLKNKETSRFYLLAGTTLFHIFEKEEKDEENEEAKRKDVYYLNIGIGIGLEFPLTKHLHASIDWPWYYDNKIKFIQFIPQAGVHYYF